MQLDAGAPFSGDELHCMQAEPLLENLDANNPRELQALCRGRKMANHRP